MGLRKPRTRLTVIICLLSEILRNDSVRERVELKSPTRHTHLDMNGMEIDDEPEDSVATGELYETIVGDVPKPVVPIMTVMGILWRVEGALKETDTRMQDGDETSRCQLMDVRPSLTTLTQARKMILTH